MCVCECVCVCVCVFVCVKMYISTMENFSASDETFQVLKA